MYFKNNKIYLEIIKCIYYSWMIINIFKDNKSI